MFKLNFLINHQLFRNEIKFIFYKNKYIGKEDLMKFNNKSDFNKLSLFNYISIYY